MKGFVQAILAKPKRHYKSREGLQCFRGRASAQAGFVRSPAPRAALEPATISPPGSTLRSSFVKKSCRDDAIWRLHLHRSLGRIHVVEPNPHPVPLPFRKGEGN